MRLINDKVVVETAVAQVVAGRGRHLAAAGSAADRLRIARAASARSLEAEMSIGFDLDVSWIEAKLHAAGVKRVKVNSPATTWSQSRTRRSRSAR